MLVLSRRQQEKVIFPHLGITIELLRTSGRGAQLGISAPAEMKVIREEVYLRKREADAESPPELNQLNFRNELNSLSLTLRSLQERLLNDDEQNIGESLEEVIRQLSWLDSRTEANENTAKREETSQVVALSPNRSALLVDDSENERALLAELIEMNGFDVDVVPDGHEALAFLRSGRRTPDVILLDMQMPNMNGVETIAAIRSDPELSQLCFKLFAVSGANREQLGVEVGPQGVDRWFSKPVDTNELLEEMLTPLSGSFSLA